MNDPAMMKLQNGSDIRGVALEGVSGEQVNLTAAACNMIGQAFARWLAEKTGKPVRTLAVGVGHDSRISGPVLEDALIAGLTVCGVTVVRCGLATTPAMFMSIIFPQTQFDGAVMMTASHLPWNRNGIKFFDADGGLEHEDITAILELASGKVEMTADITGCKTFDLVTLYAGYLGQHIRGNVRSTAETEQPLGGLKIVVDAGNGDGGFFADKILKPLGANISGSQFLNPDGTFPNHIPNPENAEAMDAIRNAVVKNKADLGLIFDTDVDRMSAVLPDGTEVNRDAIIAMTAAILAPDYPGSTIVTDSVTSDRLTYFLEQVLHLKHHRFQRGYKNVINECKRLNAAGITSPLAMETSGHGALKDNYYLDDGAFLAVKLVTALANARHEGRHLADLIEKLPPLVEAREFRFRIETDDFKSYGNSVLEKFKQRAEKAGYDLPASYEGVRISFHDSHLQGWMLLRLSLHDPVMPLNIEGGRKGDCAGLISVARTLLAGFDRLDTGALK